MNESIDTTSNEIIQDITEKNEAIELKRSIAADIQAMNKPRSVTKQEAFKPRGTHQFYKMRQRLNNEEIYIEAIKSFDTAQASMFMVERILPTKAFYETPLCKSGIKMLNERIEYVKSRLEKDLDVFNAMADENGMDTDLNYSTGRAKREEFECYSVGVANYLRLMGRIDEMVSLAQALAFNGIVGVDDLNALRRKWIYVIRALSREIRLFSRTLVELMNQRVSLLVEIAKMDNIFDAKKKIGQLMQGQETDIALTRFKAESTSKGGSLERLEFHLDRPFLSEDVKRVKEESQRKHQIQKNARERKQKSKESVSNEVAALRDKVKVAASTGEKTASETNS